MDYSLDTEINYLFIFSILKVSFASAYLINTFPGIDIFPVIPMVTTPTTESRVFVNTR